MESSTATRPALGVRRRLLPGRDRELDAARAGHRVKAVAVGRGRRRAPNGRRRRRQAQHLAQHLAVVLSLPRGTSASCPTAAAEKRNGERGSRSGPPSLVADVDQRLSLLRPRGRRHVAERSHLPRRRDAPCRARPRSPRTGRTSRRTPRTAASIAARLACRASRVAKRSSAASSGRSIADAPRGEARHGIAGHVDDGAVTEAEHRRVEAAEDVHQVALAAGELDRGPLGGLQHHLGHRHVDVLTLTGAVALHERGEDADRRLQARVQVGVRHGLGARLGVQPPRGELHQPQLGVHHRGVRPPSRHHAVLPVAGDRAVDELRVAGAHRGVAEAEPIEHTRPEVLEHDVGGGRETGDDVAAAVEAQVDGDASLPAVLLGEVHREPADPRLRRAGEVTLGRLDLDHVGAEVGQRLAARRARQHPRQVEDANAVERTRRGTVAVSLTEGP